MTMSVKSSLILAASLLALSACQPAVQSKASPEVKTQKQTQATPLQPTAPLRIEPGKKAKNVILFIGDGMGVSTITAARIFDGQSKGMSGEDNKLSFERFPEIAMVRTYNLDAQVPDSAGTASAINTGKRTQIGKINVQPDSLYAGCAKSTATPPPLFADIVEQSGGAVGVVSTARLTHATPAAVYGHAKSRGWERDSKLGRDGTEHGCLDFARQLVAYDKGDGLDVALGGGRANFLPKDKDGKRKDGMDLTQAWREKGAEHVYVADEAGFKSLKPEQGLKVLGLFSPSHMSYAVDRDSAQQPSLTEMTEFAIRNLQAQTKGKDQGYYLMVEAGRIDHAHHATNAYRALSDTQELSRAVAAADALTSDEDTLILVTADHSHVFTMAGYPKIGNPIMGLVHPPSDDESGHGPSLDSDGLPYTTLGYQNGPNVRGKTPLSEEQVEDKDYRQQAAVRRPSETHGGEDVILFAKGPGSRNVHGVIDQYQIFDIMREALGLNEKKK